TSYGQGVSGRRCPKTCRRRARCTIIWNCGTGTARWSASTTRSTWRCASRRDVKQVRRWRSSTRRPPRVLKKGALARSFGLRHGQGDQRSQADILGETLGLLLSVVVHPADVQDRDGAFHLLRRARRLFPFIQRIFADGGYAGDKMALVVWRTGAWKLEIVKRFHAAGFEVLPKRWIVERTFAWISRN